MQYQQLTAAFEEVIVELSYNCNLSCTMCGFGKDVNPFAKDKFLSFDNYKAILNQLGDKTQTIRLNGRGESIIHPEFDQILGYTKEKYPEIGINLFSNLSFSSDRILQALIESETQLFISMDSSDGAELIEIRKGAKFHFIETNLVKLKGLKNRPFIVFTIQEVNTHRIYDIAEYAFQHNCHILYNTIRRDEGVEEFEKIVKESKNQIIEQFNGANLLFEDSVLQCLYPDQLAGIKLNVNKPTQTHGTMSNCPALEKELCIQYDGTVTPCNMFNPYVYGNIFDQSLEEIWNGKERANFLRSYKNHYYCQNCANLGM